VTIDSPKDIQITSSSKNAIEIPPVVVTAINLKTIINEKQNVNEIISASVICCHKAKVCSRAFVGNGDLARLVRLCNLYYVCSCWRIVCVFLFLSDRVQLRINYD
jgi:hypothetical protein